MDSQHPHGGSQPSVTPVLGDPMPTSGLRWHQARRWYTATHAGKVLIRIQNKEKKKARQDVGRKIVASLRPVLDSQQVISVEAAQYTRLVPQQP